MVITLILTHIAACAIGVVISSTIALRYIKNSIEASNRARSILDTYEIKLKEAQVLITEYRDKLANHK